MIGIVAGVFCTLIVAWSCSYCFRFDAAWYVALVKPPYVLSGGWFTAFVCAAYASAILSVSRLVEHKHFFPSMLFFVGLGVSCILFVWAFFTLKRLALALAFMTAALAFAYVLFIRFLMKDVATAISFLPALLFDIYAFLCTLAIAMQNL